MLHKNDVDNFLQMLLERAGYDFRGYSFASIERRLQNTLIRFGLANLFELEHALADGKLPLAEFLSSFTVTASEMFRDPSFFRTLREKVFPILKTFPSIRIWHAGCSSGEEVYSLSILLKEAGLLERCQIYATDINPSSIDKTRKGVYPIEMVRSATRRYVDSGGRDEFSKYYIAEYGLAKFDSDLVANLSIFDHNLVTDGVFAEMQMILCRNVLIYFDRDLQNRVLSLFERSLCYKGFLSLGLKESVRFVNVSNKFDDFSEPERIYRCNSYSKYSAFTEPDNVP